MKKKDELVMGEIYTAVENKNRVVFRFKSIRYYGSNQLFVNCFAFVNPKTCEVYVNDWICVYDKIRGRIILDSTTEEKNKLIKAENRRKEPKFIKQWKN